MSDKDPRTAYPELSPEHSAARYAVWQMYKLLETDYIKFDTKKDRQIAQGMLIQELNPLIDSFLAPKA